jgi:hypothetical protein
MTNTEAIARITLLIDKADAPYFTDSEIQKYLELATEDFVEQNYKNFEVTQEARDNIRTLVVTDTTLFNASTSAIPANYRYFLAGTCQINGETFTLDMYQLDDLFAVTKDPFNKPSDTHPILTVEGSNFVITTDTTPPTSGVLKYLKSATMDTTAGNQINDLPAHTHYEIINAAARKMLANIDDTRTMYETQAGESAASQGVGVTLGR